MDSLSGLEKVFKEEFISFKVQCYQVHVARNVLTKVPVKLKQKVADDLRLIFYDSNKDKSIKFFNEFKDKWIKEIPSAIKCIKTQLIHV